MSGKKRNRREKVDEGEPGSWECTVCTFRNRFEAFKCEMCDTRKGTSTRKPRLNQNVVEQQQIVQNFVVQQSQAEVKRKQQTANGEATSPTPSSSRLTTTSPDGSLPSSGGESPFPSKTTTPRSTPPPSATPGSSSASTTPVGSRSRSQPPVVAQLPQLKGVDRNSARTLAVTVNGMTVVVTDYKPRKGAAAGGSRLKQNGKSSSPMRSADS
uniref:RanBP2-type domain-containing protein n=1 Tax=Plectus sambesii TaxID=2011161 RepID=A0A914WGB3_9BILA